MDNVICALDGCEKVSSSNSIYCSDACRQKKYRRKRNGVVEKAREITTLVDQSISEPFVILSHEGAERVARLARDIFTFPDDLNQDDIEKIIDPNERIFMMRWAKALYSFHNGKRIWAIAIGYDRESEFERKYNSNSKFRLKVKKETRAYQDHRSMARLKVS